MQPFEFLPRIAAELQLLPQQVAATVKLLEEGGTVPFIARYRKEATGSLDEVAITAVRDRLEALRELEARKTAIKKSLQERALLAPELEKQIDNAPTLAIVEDLYLPFRPKRRTRAMIAAERGLEPLANWLWEQLPDADPEREAANFISADKEVPDTAAALAGARDILAERLSDDPEVRGALRRLFETEAILRSRVLTGKEAEGAKYRDYFDWSEPAAKAPSHRVLAIRRGEKEGFLMMRITPDAEAATALVVRYAVKNNGAAGREVRRAAEEAYKRLLEGAMETEARLALKKRAEEAAIGVFTENLCELLLAPPLGGKRVLAIDPGFRTGCKVVVLDALGDLLHNDLIYVAQGERATAEAASKLRVLVEHHRVEAIAIGNGTGGRETESFVRKLGFSIPVVMVNESGASVYSASEIARAEFPDHDLTVRGAVSIGRRLMDPLAELVKIDPKAIGVGQYQHDVDQNGLKRSLDDTVVSCVNRVGVDLNTASEPLLQYVSGLSRPLAAGIVAWRATHGPFRTRRALLDVPRLGPKAFEQAAGFLRIRDGDHPLDASAVHPERYGLVEQMAADLGADVSQLIRDAALRAKIRPESYVTEAVGLPTLRDILEELEKPGRDPRERFEAVAFREDVLRMEDLRVGMRLPGVVTNVTAFGAFVDVGVHQDGLVHISQLREGFVKDPAEVVKVAQKVMVTVLDVDLERKRIGLSMREGASAGASSNKGDRSPAPTRTSGGARSQRPNRPERSVGRGGVSTSGNSDWFSQAVEAGQRQR